MFQDGCLARCTRVLAVYIWVALALGVLCPTAAPGPLDFGLLVGVIFPLFPINFVLGSGPEAPSI